MTEKNLEKLSNCLSMLCAILEITEDNYEITEITKAVLILNELEHKLEKEMYEKSR